MERTSPSLNSKKIVSRFRIFPAIVLSMEETGWISKAAAENRAKGKGGGGGSWLLRKQRSLEGRGLREISASFPQD